MVARIMVMTDKKVVALLTGKWIHSMKIENDVFLSPDLYRKIKQARNL